jgi:hypothetical protein
MQSVGLLMRHAASMAMRTRGLSTKEGRSSWKSRNDQQDRQLHDFG